MCRRVSGGSKVSEDGRRVNARHVIVLNSMLHVGLTGNIASGKSTAARFFSELGAHLIDADRVAHALMGSGTQTHQKIVAAFGSQILNAWGEIDRKILGRIVFFDGRKRAELNSLTHPAVEAEILRRIAELEQASSPGIIIVDAALMIEAGGHTRYDRLIVVACETSIQMSRLMHRDGLTETEARARIASQMPIEEKIKLADYIIDASGTLGEMRTRVEAIYADLQLHAGNQHRN